MTGQCEKGCDSGWTGYICEKGNYLLFLFSITIKFIEFLMLILKKIYTLKQMYVLFD